MSKASKVPDISMDQLEAPKRDTAKARRQNEKEQTGTTDARHLRNRNRSKQVIFRTTPEMWELIVDIVKVEDISITELMERSIRLYDKHTRPNKPPAVKESEDDA